MTETLKNTKTSVPQRYHIAVANHRTIPEWSFLTSDRQNYAQSVESWNGKEKIGTVKDVAIFNDVSPMDMEKFEKLATLSQVGKGKTTTWDTEIRYSLEVQAKEIKLEKPFLDLIGKKANEFGLQLGHPQSVIPKLYKMIMYKEGMKFESHIDVPHTKGTIFTMSVELASELECVGGDIAFDMKREITGVTVLYDSNAKPAHDEIKITMFYHDKKHNVTTVTKGQRIVLVFDILHETNDKVSALQLKSFFDKFMQKNLTNFQNGLNFLKSSGFKRAGMLTDHLYFGEQNKVKDLKGIDAVFYKMAESLGKKPTIIEMLCESGSFVSPKILSVFQFGSTFDELYYERESENEDTDEDSEDGDDDEDDDDEPVKEKETPKQKNEVIENVTEDKDSDEDIYSRKRKSPFPLGRTQGKHNTNKVKKFRPNTDKPIKPKRDVDGQFDFIKDEYKFGDLYLLRPSTYQTKMLYKGNDEAMLGNSGFDGEISATIVILFDL
jgi:hypothetical protein